MHVCLQPLDGASLADFIERSLATFVEQSTSGGHDPREAERSARGVLDRAFPDGAAAPGHAVFDIRVDGAGHGCIWIGPRTTGVDGLWWVWDIEIDHVYRGRGVGRRAMELAEGEARFRGATTIGLRVFQHNETARRLYESLGYVVDADTDDGLRMSKPLSEPTDAPHDG